MTPLDLAAENVSVGMVEKLLNAGADPNIAQTGGLTALMIAAHTGSVPVVKALLAHGANVQAATKETHNTALMWAIADRFPDLVKVLIEAHADVHASTTNGFTPLLYAAQNGDIDTAKTLIAAGVKVNETGADGTHALPLAILRGQADFAMFLLDQGADPNGALGGVRALHAAVASVDNWLMVWNSTHGRPMRTGREAFVGTAGSQSGHTPAVGEGATHPWRGPESSHHFVRHDDDVYRLSETGRVRTIRLRHRRHARRHSVVGGR